MRARVVLALTLFNAACTLGPASPRRAWHVAYAISAGDVAHQMRKRGPCSKLGSVQAKGPPAETGLWSLRAEADRAGGNLVVLVAEERKARRASHPFVGASGPGRISRPTMFQVGTEPEPVYSIYRGVVYRCRGSDRDATSAGSD